MVLCKKSLLIAAQLAATLVLNENKVLFDCLTASKREVTTTSYFEGDEIKCV